MKLTENYSNPNIKVSYVPPSADKEKTSTENPEAQKGTNEERSNILDAMIVRVMKARKTLKANDLIQTVIS